jgi:hypothetical protein
VLSYPDVEVGVVHAGVHNTPTAGDAEAHLVPPESVVHGLFLEQVAIFETVPLMSIVVFELIMMTK